MTQQKLLEEALKRIDSLSDEEFSSLTAEIIAESSVTKPMQSTESPKFTLSYRSLGASTYIRKRSYSNCLVYTPQQR